MLKISGEPVDIDAIVSQMGADNIRTKILKIMHSSSFSYNFDSHKELVFLPDLRRNIINAGLMLFDKRLKFRVFRQSICNEKYWSRTNEGGFLLKDGVEPLEAVNDIYTNTFMYGTECATAIVIVYYKALADTFPKDLFNKTFTDIYLMDWQNVNKDLGVSYQRNPHDYFPGDCRYFKNPDVDPLTPEWQGENAIDLGNGYFYGHGVGVLTADDIIQALNRHRKAGSENSAYLMDACTIPDFKYLYGQYENY